MENTRRCDFRMIFFNADGTEGEMCGNGARCIARYGYELGLAGKVQRIETASGIVEGERISDKIYKVRLNPVTHMDLDCVEVSGSDCGTSDCKGSNCGTTDCPTSDFQTPDCGATDCPTSDFQTPDCGASNCPTPDCEVTTCSTSICSTSERTISQNPQDKLMVSYVELGTPGLPHAVVGYKGLKSIIESKRRTDKQVYETNADRTPDCKCDEARAEGNTDCKCDGTHANRITDWNCDEVNIDAITDYNCQKFDAAKEERIARIDEELNYLCKIAKAIRYHEAFPRGANVNFYEICTSEIYVLTYERGVEDFTLACGTGVASTVAVLTEQGLVSGHGVRVHVLGGDLSVDVVSEKFPSKSVASEESEEMIKQHLYLTGEAEFVAQGEILHV